MMHDCNVYSKPLFVFFVMTVIGLRINFIDNQQISAFETYDTDDKKADNYAV